MAQDVAKQVLRSQKYSDLMSVEAISAYFKKYYKDREKELSYKVQDISIKTNLLDLLSLNQNRKKTIVDNRSENYFHRQAFRTAGELFHVISNDTVAVIVPDNDEAVELIAALHSEKYSSEFVKILRKAQKYIVEIYSDMEKNYWIYTQSKSCLLEFMCYKRNTMTGIQELYWRENRWIYSYFNNFL